jgi:hypothetical protein
MQNAYVSQGKTMMDKIGKGRVLPCTYHLRSLYGGQFDRCAVPMSMGKKEAKKKQKDRIDGKSALSSLNRSCKSGRLQIT